VNLMYIPFWEEADLARRFGRSYLEYTENVPRWIPRVRPWSPHSCDKTERPRGVEERIDLRDRRSL
jgi:hypothetical protein